MRKIITLSVKHQPAFAHNGSLKRRHHSDKGSNDKQSKHEQLNMPRTQEKNTAAAKSQDTQSNETWRKNQIGNK